MGSRGANKAILVGNIGQDPETKYTAGGMAVTKISLATTSVRKDKEGNTQENTQWHRVTFFGKLGEIAGEYLRKGSQVYVEGEIRYDKYTGQDGVEKYFTDIVANEMQMLGGREGAQRSDSNAPTQRNTNAGGQQRNSNGNGQQPNSSGGGQQRNPNTGGNQRPPPPPAQGFADDDDAPF